MTQKEDLAICLGMILTGFSARIWNSLLGCPLYEEFNPQKIGINQNSPCLGLKCTYVQL